MRTTDFDFYLPDDLIAQFPAKERTASRLLRLDGKSGKLADEKFIDLPEFISPGDLLVFNNTKVIKARLAGSKATGGQIEALIERVIDSQHALAHIKSSRSPKPGTKLFFANAFETEVVERQDDLFLLKLHHQVDWLDLLDQYGSLPLPPYIEHDADAHDEERYQTVYARDSGAVAAPTAGLHLSEAFLEALQIKGVEIQFVTLHVGAGTFQPVRVENIAEHRMHPERYFIPHSTMKAVQKAKADNRRITAVGTTSLRALEASAEEAQEGQFMAEQGDTRLFITPGYGFKIVDRLLTNFHLPKSTLLMLVQAFGGVERLKHAYLHAVQERYRFFSYGDAMVIDRAVNI